MSSRTGIRNRHAWLGMVVVAISLVFLTSGLSHAENKNHIGIALWGAADPDTTAFVGAVEYERPVMDKLTVVGRIGTLTYDYDDGDNEEDGDGLGVEGGVRYYFTGEMEAWFVGGSIGFWDTDWDFVDDVGQPFQLRGSGSSTAVNAAVNGGYRFKFGDTVSLTPNAIVGNFIGVDDTCNVAGGGSCGNETQLGLYAAIGVFVAFSF